MPWLSGSFVTSRAKTAARQRVRSAGRAAEVELTSEVYFDAKNVCSPAHHYQTRRRPNVCEFGSNRDPQPQKHKREADENGNGDNLRSTKFFFATGHDCLPIDDLPSAYAYGASWVKGEVEKQLGQHDRKSDQSCRNANDHGCSRPRGLN